MPAPGRPGRAGATQLLVRATMLQAGGYWRPLAAVARLLEELGELAELLAGDARSEEDLAGELADVWIITTALADQYLAVVPEPASTRPGNASLPALVAAAGPIARVVNHYDGPKTPRSDSSMPSLGQAIAAFHVRLGALAGALEVDLAGAVAGKLQTIRARGDLTRFERSGHDPSTAPALGRYRDSPHGEGVRTRLWGAPDWQRDDTVAANAAAARPWLEAFAKAAGAEGLEGFVVPGPRLGSPEQRLSWAGEMQDVLFAHSEGAPPVLASRGLPLRASLSVGPDGETFLLLAPAPG